jgi:hypothetical protein
MSTMSLEERVTAAVKSLEERVEALEGEVTRLKQARPNGAEPPQPWWEAIWGTFKDDPEYEEAMRLGREYRESLRPKDEEDEDLPS